MNDQSRTTKVDDCLTIDEFNAQLDLVKKDFNAQLKVCSRENKHNFVC